jgi:hypothetical protein
MQNGAQFVRTQSARLMVTGPGLPFESDALLRTCGAGCFTRRDFGLIDRGRNAGSDSPRVQAMRTGPRSGPFSSHLPQAA